MPVITPPDPAEVLVGHKAVEYHSHWPVPSGDEGSVFPVRSPQRKRKGR
jgi:hypothetical protein